ncbi:MAG: DUF2585 family protein [Planctomycetota bacterium]
MGVIDQMKTKIGPVSGRSACLLGLLGLSVVVGGVLWRMGQPIWCQCGRWKIASWQVYSSHNSQHLVDPYTFTHVSHGLLFGMAWLVACRIGKRFQWSLPHPKKLVVRGFFVAMTVESAWEIIENTPWIINRYREATISLDYFGDSVINSLGDLWACAIGFWIVGRLGWRPALALLVGMELALLLTIRDSLLLNVIMLTFPNDAIRQWQTPPS